jgi:Fatty acid desaturase
VEPSNFNCLLHKKYYTTKLPGETIQRILFHGSWRRIVPETGRNQDLPTTRVVQVMVEKSTFTAPTAADVARRVIPTFARYREPSHCRSIFEIAVTLVPFVALWALAWAAVHFGYWELSLLLGVPAAGFLIRLFVIQHDCGHGSFFRNRPANDWVGRFLGVLTLSLTTTGAAHVRLIMPTRAVLTNGESATSTR